MNINFITVMSKDSIMVKWYPMLYSDEWIAACTEFVLDEQNLLSRCDSLTEQQVKQSEQDFLESCIYIQLCSPCLILCPFVLLLHRQPASATRFFNNGFTPISKKSVAHRFRHKSLFKRLENSQLFGDSRQFWKVARFTSCNWAHACSHAHIIELIVLGSGSGSSSKAGPWEIPGSIRMDRGCGNPGLLPTYEGRPSRPTTWLKGLIWWIINLGWMNDKVEMVFS